MAKDKKAAKKATPAKKIDRPYPRRTLEDALQIPQLLKEKNGGNPWSPEALAGALGVARSNTNFFYLVAASREFGLTSGSRDSDAIALEDLGRTIAYAPNPTTEAQAKRQAFLSVEPFKKVLEYYKGSGLPEMKYLSNTLENQFGLHPDVHAEFVELFRKNCDYLGIGASFAVQNQIGVGSGDASESSNGGAPDIVTLAEPEQGEGLHCFVVMPFNEREDRHPPGFFDEVLKSLIAPAGKKAGFIVTTANREGTEVIQSTIVNNLLDAELVVADLTEHNPNVLFELGMRMAFDKPVALIRAKGTGRIFDVDNMLRVYEYDANLWTTTISRDLPGLVAHIKATWNNRTTESTYLRLLRRTPSPASLLASPSTS